MTLCKSLSGDVDKYPENGVVSPTGVFFDCESGSHDVTCEEFIGANRQYLEKAGWIFIIKSKIWMVDPDSYNWTIPQEQYKFLREYIDKYPDPTSMFWELRVTKSKRQVFPDQ